MYCYFLHKRLSDKVGYTQEANQWIGYPCLSICFAMKSQEQPEICHSFSYFSKNELLCRLKPTPKHQSVWWAGERDLDTNRSVSRSLELVRCDDELILFKNHAKLLTVVSNDSDIFISEESFNPLPYFSRWEIVDANDVGLSHVLNSSGCCDSATV